MGGAYISPIFVVALAPSDDLFAALDQMVT
jgi:hypothetical protein